MINENEATRKLLQRWIKKKKKGGGIPGRDAKVGELEANEEKALEEAQCRQQEAAEDTGGKRTPTLPPNVKVTEVRMTTPNEKASDDDDEDEDDD